MVIYVNESGSAGQELVEGLVQEGVTFKESSGNTSRESSTAGWRTVAVAANLPEVRPVSGDFPE